MRKTKQCDHSKVEQRGATLRMRTCLLPRDHQGEKHTDEEGNWTHA